MMVLRCQRSSDVSRLSPIGDQIEDNKTISELRRTSSTRKSKGTPIKMFIAKEMSKEVDSKQNPSSVVAKLMGLDALPRQQLESSSQRSHSRSSSQSQSGMSFGYLQQEHGLLETQQPQIHQYTEQNDYKDVYEIWQSHNNYIKDKSPQKERFNGSRTEKKMALVRQNFIELKRLAPDEKLRRSKQFQDALEVLSSNKDSFLKFLQEPNSMFSQHLYDLQSIPPPTETKRITVLKPSKIVNNKFTESGKKNEKQINKTSQFGQVNRWDKSTPGFSPPVSKLEDCRTRATRIVVLKPSPGKSHDIKAVLLPLSSSPRALNVEDSCGEPEDDDAQESREVAKEITRQMCENLSGHRRDETLLSSVLSNGYTGDESSFNKSENEYAAENLSDSEVVSSTSRHSWDYVDRFGSPYSLSSSRASYSPESSVCREAKERLSERWAMMASNGIDREQRHIRRSSSTLGEMLALSDMNKSVRPVEDGSNKEQESRVSTSFLTSDSNDKDICATTSPRNLLRSKSVPVSSTAYGARLNLEVSDPKMEKTDVTKEATKERSVKSSFKGRVSSLFFSRNKKSSKEKSIQSIDEIESAGMPRLSPGNDVDASAYGSDIGFKVGVLPNLNGLSSKASSLDSFGMSTKQDVIPNKTEFSVTKPCTNGNPNENQEQPSPISVLEPPFDEDDHREPEFSNNFKPDGNGLDLPVHSIKSNLIDKSPLIGSIARTLSWDDSCTETATTCPLKSSVAPIGAKEEQQEWFFFVQALLSAANFDSEVQSDTFLARWHSLESPLDPSLRDKYIELNEKETLHEAKRRQRRSTRKLVFDCVNAALVDIAGYGSDTWQRAIPCSGPNDRLQDRASTIMDCVWVQMRQWFSGEVRCVFGECGDNNSLVVERVVRKEAVGNGWVEHLRLEIDNFRKEIERKLVEELVQEAVEEFTGRV